jgi:hypothetical protein
LLAVLALALPQNVDRLLKETLDAEEKLAMSRILIPPCTDAAERADFEKVVTRDAAKAEVQQFIARHADDDTAVPGAGGAAAPLRLRHFDLAGQGRFSEVHYLLTRIATFRAVRILDFETLHLQPHAGGAVGFNARVAVACWVDPPAPETKLPDRGAVAKVEDVEAALYRQRLDLIRSYQATVDQLGERMEPHALTDALFSLDGEWGERAVFLNELRYAAPDLTLRGVAIGMAAHDAVAPALKKAGLDAAPVEWTAAADCRAFIARGTTKSIPAAAHELAVHELFDERAASSCNPAPGPPAKTIRVRGTGPIMAQTHEIALSSALYLLNGVSSDHGYVVAPSVEGRVRLDLDHATIDDTLVALRTAGFAISKSPVHLVCSVACGDPPSRGQPSDPISFTITDAQVKDVLRTMEQIANDSIQLYAPPDLRGEVSLYLVDVPWTAVLDAVATVLGKTISMAPAAALVHVDELHTPPWRRAIGVADPAKLAVADVRLAGIAHSGDTWLAYADVLGAPGRVIELAAGTKLLDGEVIAVGPSKVTLKANDGRVVVVAGIKP